MNAKHPVLEGDASRPPLLLLSGDFNWQHVDVAAVAKSLNWEVQAAGALPSECEDGEVRAVFCLVDGDDTRPIEEARRSYPRARIVACSRFRCTVDWDRMAASGAFHHLRLPFNECEVKLSLGFLATAIADEAVATTTAPHPLRQLPPARELIRKPPVRHRPRFRWNLRPA